MSNPSGDGASPSGYGASQANDDWHRSPLADDGVVRDEDIRLLCRDARRGMPAATPIEIVYAVSFDVIALILGHDWAVRNVSQSMIRSWSPRPRLNPSSRWPSRTG